MTDASSNRFTAMFEKTGVTERKKTKKSVDFGQCMTDDVGINATFRAIHIVAATPLPIAAQSVVETLIPRTDSEEDPLDRMIDQPLDGQTVVPSGRQTVTQYNGDTVRQSDRETAIRSDHHTDRLSQTQTESQYRTDMQYIPLDVLTLAHNQAIILKYLILNKSGITNARSISDQTDIKIPSVREALSRLAFKGFMRKPVTVRDATFQGFSYVLNKALCDHFINAGGLDRQQQTGTETVTLSNSMTERPPDGVTIHSSSSKSFQEIKSTTTPDYQTLTPSDRDTVKPSDQQPIATCSHRPSEGFILTGVVRAYWEEEGLTEGQAQKWCQQFSTSPEQMWQQLDWARFDLQINGRRDEVTKNPVSWFFGHLRTTGGCFPRPVNYRSPLEIRAEALKQQQERDREALATIEAIEFENTFQKFLAETDAPLYRKLLSQISKFASERLQDGDKMVAEIELRELFRNRSWNSQRHE